MLSATTSLSQTKKLPFLLSVSPVRNIIASKSWESQNLVVYYIHIRKTIGCKNGFLVPESYRLYFNFKRS